jgi:hypothetical protein
MLPSIPNNEKWLFTVCGVISLVVTGIGIAFAIGLIRNNAKPNPYLPAKFRKAYRNTNAGFYYCLFYFYMIVFLLLIAAPWFCFSHSSPLWVH